MTGSAAATVTRRTVPDRSTARRTLAIAGIAHALHDGYTDAIYVLLPVWQTEFALGYGTLAMLRGLYAGAMAAMQIPAGRLAEQIGGRTVLALCTGLVAIGYALVGFSGTLLGLCAALTCPASAQARSTRSNQPRLRGPTALRPAVRWAPTTSPTTWGRPRSRRSPRCC